ncbi:hypothetical protein L1887_58686 [Cichorium endivia]|nr:hypothetical protein L1887_58686 [Cichorium endivia]
MQTRSRRRSQSHRTRCVHVPTTRTSSLGHGGGARIVATACWTSDASSVAAAYKVAIDAEPVPVRGPRDADRMWCCEVSSLVDSQIQDDVDASECPGWCGVESGCCPSRLCVELSRAGGESFSRHTSRLRGTLLASTQRQFRAQPLRTTK